MVGVITVLALVCAAPLGPTTPDWTGRCGRDQRLCDFRRADAELAPRPPRCRPGRSVQATGVCGRRGPVVFASELAGRAVVSIAHPGGLRTSYEPVRPSVRVGQLVEAGTSLGELAAGHDDCAGRVPALGRDVGCGLPR